MSLGFKRLNRNPAHMECKSKSDTSNNMGHWNHLIITQNVSEQHTGKSRNQGTTKTAILGTAHILRKVLMQEYKTYFTDEITLQMVNIEKLQHYIPTKHGLFQVCLFFLALQPS